MTSSRRDHIRAEALRLLTAGIAGNVFPGGVACVSWRPDGKEVETIETAAGLMAMPGATGPGSSASGKLVREDTLYDLASLTKPIFATTVLRLADAGKLSLDTKPETSLADTRGTTGGAATLEQLLSHRAGLAAWGGLYLDVPHDLGSSAARRWVLAEACRRPDEALPPGKALYSDLGYIIAGELVARTVGQDLETLLGREIRATLKLTDTELLYPPGISGDRAVDFARRVAPTERDEWRGRWVRGEVHDENCAALGGIAGHAGMFGTAKAVATVGRAVLDAYLKRGETPIVSHARIASALEERPPSTLRLGWDGKSKEGSSGGRRLSAKAFGHLGFTGTSVWCDPERDLVIVLLTNRICPSRANEKIKGFRPAFHDGVLAAIDG